MGRPFFRIPPPSRLFGTVLGVFGVSLSRRPPRVLRTRAEQRHCGRTMTSRARRRRRAWTTVVRADRAAAVPWQSYAAGMGAAACGFIKAVASILRTWFAWSCCGWRSCCRRRWLSRCSASAARWTWPASSAAARTCTGSPRSARTTSGRLCCSARGCFWSSPTRVTSPAPAPAQGAKRFNGRSLWENQHLSSRTVRNIFISISLIELSVLKT